MTPDEARKLLGGYATGSLSEAERTALFHAALEDQDLFDELAGEQVLKEVLDEPGARQRLIAALEPRRHRAWLWITAAATVALAVVIGIVVSDKTPPVEPPQQIAQVLKPPEPAAAPEAPPAVAPPPPSPKRKVPPTPSPAAPAELRKEETAAAADQVQQAKPLAAPQAATGAVRQFAAARVASVFGFNYTVAPDGFLVITPTAFGFLSVTADDSVISPVAGVNAGTPVRIAIPSGATSLVVAFSATPGITDAPVRRDGASGTVTDQDPPNGRILIQLFLTPATR